jgi:tetrahydromethanopterin S-methyltransferase subunit B
MEIFQSEIDDGLQHSLSSEASISYASLVEKSNNSKPSNIDFKALAGIDDKDLYYTQSILVTTSWNKNDDIFDRTEVWMAKSTPAHKPTNLEHDESVIVGHITSNYPITQDGVLIDENTPMDNLPEKFHILTGSVIYTGYTDPELRARSTKLIEEIENGNKYVSMECFFNGFDYGLINNATGEYKILPRNKETAFLTKHLRAYGGIGQHENYKIGRVLRNITFSGKGFVDRPANPESIIFTKDAVSFDKQIVDTEIAKEKNDTFQKIGVFSNQANLKENIMSLDLDPVLNEVAELKQKIEAMTLASATQEKITQLEETIKAQEAALQDAKTALDTLSLEKEEAAKKVDEEMKKKEEMAMKMKAELDAATEVIAAYKSQEAMMMKKEKKMKRMASLIENGIDSELATSTVDKFEDLSDDAFEAIAALVVNLKPVKATVETEASIQVAAPETQTETKAEETKAEDVSEVLENVETEKEIDLSVGAESDNEINATRAALVDFVRTRLGKKLNKGE